MLCFSIYTTPSPLFPSGSWPHHLLISCILWSSQSNAVSLIRRNPLQPLTQRHQVTAPLSTITSTRHNSTQYCTIRHQHQNASIHHCRLSACCLYIQCCSPATSWRFDHRSKSSSWLNLSSKSISLLHIEYRNLAMPLPSQITPRVLRTLQSCLIRPSTRTPTLTAEMFRALYRLSRCRMDKV